MVATRTSARAVLGALPTDFRTVSSIAQQRADLRTQHVAELKVTRRLKLKDPVGLSQKLPPPPAKCRISFNATRNTAS